MENEGAVRERLEGRAVVALATRQRVHALGVKHRVDRIGAGRSAACPAPGRREAHVVLVPALGTRPVPGGKGRGLVEEEERRIAPGQHQRTAIPAAKLQPASDPAPSGEAAPEASSLVVEAAAVAEDQAAAGLGDDLSGGRGAVLECHGVLKQAGGSGRLIEVSKREILLLAVLVGFHAILFSSDAEADRSFFKDVLGLRSADAGDGWPIFALPPAELAVHPGEGGGEHRFYLICDDLAATLAELEAKGGVTVTSAPREQSWGVIAAIALPSGAELAIYEPRHPRP